MEYDDPLFIRIWESSREFSCGLSLFYPVVAGVFALKPAVNSSVLGLLRLGDLTNIHAVAFRTYDRHGRNKPSDDIILCLGLVSHDFKRTRDYFQSIPIFLGVRRIPHPIRSRFSMRRQERAFCLRCGSRRPHPLQDLDRPEEED